MAFGFFKKKDKKDTKKATPKAADVVVPKDDVVAKPEEKTTEVAAPAAPITGVSVLRYAHVSEKSSRAQAIHQYTFIVTPNATKSEVAKEVATRYKVTVKSVNILNRGGKSRRVGRYTGTTGKLKKAMVTIADGQTIAAA